MKIQKLDVPFAQVPNELLCDKKLSLKSKGLWAYIQSKPNDYDFSSKRIADETKDSVDSIQTGLKELEELGYLLRNKKTDGRVDYVLIFQPKQENPVQTQNRILPTISNKDNTNKVIDNNIITYVMENPSQEVKTVSESREFFETMNEKGEKFTTLVGFISEKYKVAPAFIAEELVAFVSYWTEKNHSGTKMRWQLQKTFEPKRRLVTWFKNKRDWNKGRTQQPNKYQVDI